MKRHIRGGDLVVRIFGIKHVKAVVMLGRKDHISHPGVFRGLCPFVGIKADRVKYFRQGLSIEFFIAADTT